MGRGAGQADVLSHAVLAASSLPILVTDATQPDNPIVYVNAAFGALYGYTVAEIVGCHFRSLQGADTDAFVSAEIDAAIDAGRSVRRNILNYRKDGTSFWSELTIDPIHDAGGEVTGFIGIQREMEPPDSASGEPDRQLTSIAENISGYLYRRVMRRDGAIEIVYCSPSLRRLIGMAADAPFTLGDIIHPDDYEPLVEAIRNSAADMTTMREEFRLNARDGSVRWIRSSAPPQRMPSGDIVWDGVAVEISAEKRWETEIASQALRDSLTGVLNRAAWRQALELQFSSDHAAPCGVIYVDINGFHDINDHIGQAAGDDILRETAARLAGLAETVGGVVGRQGGDEFAMLVAGCPGAEALAELCEATRTALADPIEVAGKVMVISTCVGATFFDGEPTEETTTKGTAGEVMMQAELALRWAKQGGCGTYGLYARERDERFHHQTMLAQSLEKAIAGGELELHYQPIVDLPSGRIVSAEALVRWRHPQLGMLLPDLFIPLAEKLGLIGKLGAWTLDETLRQRRAWQADGVTPPPISLNVSGSQLLEPGFVALIEAALARWDTTAEGLDIELTEGVLIEPSPEILAVLHALRDLGFTITIDDFGSGHASFRYLRDFPVDKLKIDQIFVRKLVLESTDALIIRAIISLARSMGIMLVAEGIETEMQRDFLQSEGCEIGQGYLFSMPLIPEDFAWAMSHDVRLPLYAGQSQ